MYSNDYGDKLPFSPGPFFGWGMGGPPEFVADFGAHWMSRLYCPSPTAYKWSVMQLSAAEGPVWLSMNYACAIGDRVASTNVTDSYRPKPWRIAGVEVHPSPSERVILADPTVSRRNDRDPADENFKSGAHYPGDVPAGGNLLFLDNHVAWRDFSAMHVRTVAVPMFWW